ncbi:hypothetical protein D3C76_1542540 [compost metagenome]
MHRKRNVVIPLIGNPVRIPAIVQIVRIDKLQIFIHNGLIERQARLLESDIDEHGEHQPVIRVGMIHKVNLVQPRVYLLLLLLTQRIPELMRGQGQAEAKDRLFHHPLVLRLKISPVLLMRRIGSMDDAFQE